MPYDYATLRRHLLTRCRSAWRGKRHLQRDLANLRLCRNLGFAA